MTARGRSSGQRTLIERLFWNEETEAQIARSLGVIQQAASKRTRTILKALQRRLEPTAEESAGRVVRRPRLTIIGSGHDEAPGDSDNKPRRR